MNHNVFETMILPSDVPLLVAVSGGVDSMALLSLVMERIPVRDVFVAHFHHTLRQEADADEMLVAHFCQQKGISFFREQKDIALLAQQEKASIETVARKYRYLFFARLCREHNFPYVLTAHHLDDAIETALFNLIRGTGMGGIHALAREREHRSPQGSYTLLRPLLDIPKSALRSYAYEKALPFCEDSTNEDIRYQRNFIRQNILPLFEKINPAYRQAFNHFLQTSRFLESHVDTDIALWFSNQKERYRQKVHVYHHPLFFFSKHDFFSCDAAFQKALVVYIYKKLHRGSIGLSFARIEEMIHFFAGPNSYGERVVPSGKIERRGEWILVLG